MRILTTQYHIETEANINKAIEYHFKLAYTNNVMNKHRKSCVMRVRSFLLHISRAWVGAHYS